MKIDTHYNALELHKDEKIFYAHFLKPHRVLSTCRANGGLREDLQYLYNHQSCEPTAHKNTDLCQIAVKEPQRYQERICNKAGINPATAASLGTAANMNNSVVVRASFKDLEVIAVTTAGVGGNAGRAGDPASYYQSEDGTIILDKPAPLHGTINIMVFLSQELTAGASVAAATVITEAKTAVLQELSAPSKYSSSIATGTGTDQIGIASLLDSKFTNTDSNKHSKTGELIGNTVSKSLYKALNLQCGLTPDSRRSSLVYLARFGDTEKRFIEEVQNELPKEEAELLKNNFLSVNHDPVTVSCIQSIVHIRDQFTWGVLPSNCTREILANNAAQIAAAVANKPTLTPQFREELSEHVSGLTNKQFLYLIHKAIALGYAEKWKDRFQD